VAVGASISPWVIEKLHRSRLLTVKVSELVEKDSRSLVIEDNGIGMSETECREATKFFKRFHNSSKIEGAGLGLGIVNQIVKAHNFSLKVEPGKPYGLRISVQHLGE